MARQSVGAIPLGVEQGADVAGLGDNAGGVDWQCRRGGLSTWGQGSSRSGYRCGGNPCCGSPSGTRAAATAASVLAAIMAAKRLAAAAAADDGKK